MDPEGTDASGVQEWRPERLGKSTVTSFGLCMHGSKWNLGVVFFIVLKCSTEIVLPYCLCRGQTVAPSP